MRALVFQPGRLLRGLLGASAVLLGGLVLGSGGAYPQDLDDDSCIGCHSESGLTAPNGRKLEAISEKTLEGSPHEGFGCASCHELNPKANLDDGRTIHPKFPTVDCATCHEQTAGKDGKPYAGQYRKSVHGLAREKRRDMMAPACQDCHGAHKILPADDPASRISRKHVKETCSRCHVESAKKNAGKIGAPARYGAKAHSDLVRKNPDLKNAICTDCHGEHAIPERRDMPLIIVSKHVLEGVPFNHLRHEKAVVSCGVCHHRSLRGCKNCHTLEASAKGGGVSAYEAYHWSTATHSCVGCHERQKEKSNCAVCHESMSPGPSELSCAVCHAGGSKTGERSLSDPSKAVPAGLPDVITVKTLKKELGPVKFPHKHVVESLNSTLGKNRLANIFHNGRRVVCTACHHHSPMGEKPPSCATCHLQKQDFRNLNKPSLKGAYHRKCLGCHKDMDVKNYIICSSCHVKGAPKGEL